MTSSNSSSQKALCFVIGPIGQDGSDTRKHADMMLHGVIKHVVESDQFNYKCKRADEETRPGMINDRIILDIINADVVVADLTELNPNAFYELGIRHATQKPTIHIAGKKTSLPFDNYGHSAIFVDVTDWHSIEASRLRLAEALTEVKKPNYFVSNPLTQAKASFEMKISADPTERVIAELQQQIQYLNNKLVRPPFLQLSPAPGETADDTILRGISHGIFRYAKNKLRNGKIYPEISEEIRKYASELNIEMPVIQATDRTLSIFHPGRFHILYQWTDNV